MSAMVTSRPDGAAHGDGGLLTSLDNEQMKELRVER